MISRRGFLASTAGLAGGISSRARGEPALLAGVARVDITPSSGIWMAGFAARREPARGTALALAAKALALGDAERRLVLVTLDLLGVTASMRARIAARLAVSRRLAPECLMLAASHTHCGPVVDDQLSVAYDLDAPARARITEYTAWLEQSITVVAEQALDALAPARIAWGETAAAFGANRRVAFLPPGPSDSSVPIVEVADARGRPVALLFGYACHNTTLQAAMVEFHGDYAGAAQREIEARVPGVQAMFLAGCGADVNPAPRGTLALADGHGRTLADAVLAGRGRLWPTTGRISAGLASVELPFAPSGGKAAWEERLGDADVYVQRHARLMLERLARDGELERAHHQPVQVWRLGTITLLALGGEVVSDYALRLKREHASERLWVAAYANDVSCYVPSLRVLDEGGYEGGGAMLYYGRPGPFTRDVEQRLVAAATHLMTHVR
jgi:neutral ceramidase